MLESQCGWNRSWVPAVLEPCVATKCQHIPLPPPDIGMVYLPGRQLSPHLLSDQTELYPFNTSDESNSLSLQSELSVYNPSLPLTMRFPGPGFCLENNLFMIVGSIPAKTKKNLEVYFVANGTDEAFHMREGFEIKSRPLILQLIRLDYYTFVPLVWRWRRSTFGGGQCLRISPRICRDSQETELR